MRILVSGASGLVGSALVPALREDGHRLWRLVRGAAGAEDAVRWDPAAGEIDRPALAACAPEGVVHLAGESIAGGRWTAAKKARIRDSRVRGTELLARACAALETPPRLFVSASAIGYYGDRGEQLVDEDSPPGTGFLAGVCRRWEAAAEPVRQAGARLVWLRLGVVLAKEGGALAQMLTPFRLGLGGKVGSGRQWLSWIALDDVVGVVRHLLAQDGIAGPLNTVAPQPVRNRELTRALGRALKRPAVLPLPAFAARLILGEMADELLLASTRVDASRLVASGYAFRWPQLEPLLAHLLA
ncbi:MAG: TIGR01777 family protein [Acidobacteria bacterium]|nr:MAG: TIGR01777 family protein [Acidobacteriota bacterium]